MKIGVLASQGAFAEHITALKRLSAEAVPVRLPRELNGVDGLIIPGGESTVIARLMLDDNLSGDIRELARSGLPVMGTCAGVIVMSKKVFPSTLEPLRIMDISVRRNVFGRQQESFETELPIPALGEPAFPAIFIRAPAIEQVNGAVKVLARLADDTIVAARQGKLLVLAFHPELTDDLRFHRYFLDIIAGKQ